MTELQSTENAAFWSESLAEELLYFLTKRLKCPEAAAEITHETFLRIYQNISDNPPNNARAMAFHIAINLANDYQRKIKVRNNYTADVDATFLADTPMPAKRPGRSRLSWRNNKSRFYKAHWMNCLKIAVARSCCTVSTA